MRKLLIIFLVLLMSLPAYACASSIDLSSMTDTELTQLRADIDAELTSRSPELADGEVSGELGDYSITIKDARMGKDYNKNDAIIVKFGWSHKKEESKSFMLAFNIKAFQDGIELESAIFLDKSVDSAQQMLEIRSGASIDVDKGFILRNTTSPVEIEVTDLFSFTSKDKVVKTFNLPL